MATSRDLITLITHGDLAVHNPLSVGALEEAVAHAAPAAPGRAAAEHAGEPEAPDVLAWVDAARRRLLAPGGRDTIGFGVVLLRRVS